MSYKTILVQLDSAPRCVERVRLATSLTMLAEAHLVGAAATGISRFAFAGGWTADGGGYPDLVAAQLDLLGEQAKACVNSFEQQAAAAGLSTYEGLVLEDEAGAAIAIRGRYADLVVLGQTDPGRMSAAVPPDLPEYVTLHCGQPVLLVPYAGDLPVFGQRAIIAWDGSPSAMRAVKGALPLLRRAKQVDVAVWEGDKRDIHGEQPGDDLALYLARHQVKVNVIRSYEALGSGEALLTLAADNNAALLVMGCYGHARMRELVMGGVTRTVLSSATLPVLMAH